MVSGRIEYKNSHTFISKLNNAGKLKVHEITVDLDQDLPTLTNPTTPDYDTARAKQLFMQKFKAASNRLWSAPCTDYWQNAVAWIERNILIDLEPAQVKSLGFRVDKMDKDTGQIIVTRYPAKKDEFLLWTDIMKIKAFAMSGLSMAKLVTTTRSSTPKDAPAFEKDFLD